MLLTSDNIDALESLGKFLMLNEKLPCCFKEYPVHSTNGIFASILYSALNVDGGVAIVQLAKVSNAGSLVVPRPIDSHLTFSGYIHKVNYKDLNN